MYAIQREFVFVLAKVVVTLTILKRLPRRLLYSAD
jgi:hypothetical protein